MKDKLNSRQAHFVREYIVDKNGTRAARAAGYKDTAAIGVTASQLLSNPKVKAAVDLGLSLQLKQADLRAEDVVAELRKLGFSNFGSYAKFGSDGLVLNNSDTLTADQLAAVSEISETTTKEGGSLRFKLHDKHAALVTLGRHFNIFSEARPADDEGDGLTAPSARLRVEARLLAIGERVTLERVVTERVIVERPGDREGRA